MFQKRNNAAAANRLPKDRSDLHASGLALRDIVIDIEKIGRIVRLRLRAIGWFGEHIVGQKGGSSSKYLGFPILTYLRLSPAAKKVPHLVEGIQQRMPVLLKGLDNLTDANVASVGGVGEVVSVNHTTRTNLLGYTSEAFAVIVGYLDCIDSFLKIARQSEPWLPIAVSAPEAMKEALERLLENRVLITRWSDISNAALNG